MKLERRCFVAEMKSERNGDVQSWISTEDIDRVGDIIKAKGWELEGFKKSGGPVLYGHEPSAVGSQISLIGNAIEIEIQGKGLWAVTRFHEKTQLSRDAAILARERILPSWSVGFRALERPKDRIVDGEWKGFIFNKAELLEYSLVPVPANPEARSKAEHLMRKGLISGSIVLSAAPSRAQTRPGRPDEDALGTVIRAGAARIRVALESARRSISRP